MENGHETDRGFFNMDSAALERLIADYPWFSSARIRRCALEGTRDEMLGLTLLTKPYPSVMLQTTFTPPSGAPVRDNPAKTDTDAIIDKFLASGDVRIVPKDDTPDEDVSEDSSVFIPEEDMDTEELERIYREQGLEKMADEVSDLVEDTMEEI